MSKVNKWTYYNVLQGHYGYHGWEDICQADSSDDKERADLRRDLRDYRKNAPEYSYRIATRRELNPAFALSKSTPDRSVVL